jgi:pumilio family protein 6
VQKNLDELLQHKYGSRVLLALLHPTNTRYLPPHLAAIVNPPQKSWEGDADATGPLAEGTAEATEGEAAEGKKAKRGKKGVAEKDAPVTAPSVAAASIGEDGVDGEEEEEGGTEAARAYPTSGPLGQSKKDPDARRRELLGGKGTEDLGTALCTLCSQSGADLLRSQHACDLVLEVCRGGDGGVLAACAGNAAVDAVHDALVAAAAESWAEKAGPAAAEGAAGAKEGSSAEHVLVEYFSSRTLRRLVLASTDAGTPGQLASTFVEKLWAGALQGKCAQWYGSHADKVLAAVLQSGSAAVAKAAAKELMPLLGKQKAADWSAKFVHAPPTKPKARKN